METLQRCELHTQSPSPKSSAYLCRKEILLLDPVLFGSGQVGIAVSLSPVRKCPGVNAPALTSACTINLQVIAEYVATRVVF